MPHISAAIALKPTDAANLLTAALSKVAVITTAAVSTKANSPTLKQYHPERLKGYFRYEYLLPDLLIGFNLPYDYYPFLCLNVCIFMYYEPANKPKCSTQGIKQYIVYIEASDSEHILCAFNK